MPFLAAIVTTRSSQKELVAQRMTEEDKQYFERRAEAEIAMACGSSETAAVQAHYTMACVYLDRLYSEGEQGAPRDP